MTVYGHEGWKVVNHQARGRMAKYMDQLVVILSRGKKAAYLYLPPKIVAALHQPDRIEVMSRGSNLALVKCGEGAGFAMSKSRPSGSTPYITVTTVAEQFNLKAGAYTAHIEGDLVVFDSADTPSVL